VGFSDDSTAGSAGDGLTAISSSTNFTADASGIVMDEPAAAHTVALLRGQFTGTAGTFAALQPGDAVNFGFYRNGGTSTGSIFIAGVSIVYQKK
jgi:hypothetical protein